MWMPNSPRLNGAAVAALTIGGAPAIVICEYTDPAKCASVNDALLIGTTYIDATPPEMRIPVWR
jgi:hypothetical protein